LCLSREKITVAQTQGAGEAVRNLAGACRLVREYKCQVSSMPVSVHGTAFFIHPSGIAVTCDHVLRYAWCKHNECGGESNGKLFSNDKKFFVYQVIGQAPQYDLAFLRIGWNEPVTSIPILEHEAYVSENAHGMSNLNNKGLFYVRGHLSTVIEMQTEFLAHPKMSVFNMPTDAGASGGPIISDRGELIAVVCGRVDNNFALGIPASDILVSVPRTPYSVILAGGR